MFIACLTDSTGLCYYSRSRRRSGSRVPPTAPPLPGSLGTAALGYGYEKGLREEPRACDHGSNESAGEQKKKEKFAVGRGTTPAEVTARWPLRGTPAGVARGTPKPPTGKSRFIFVKSIGLDCWQRPTGSASPSRRARCSPSRRSRCARGRDCGGARASARAARSPGPSTS